MLKRKMGNRRYNYMIDFMKCVAMLCVVSLHVGIIAETVCGFEYSEKTWIFKTPAWSAVWIFFTLSGALNGISFYNEKYTFDKKGLIQFYKSRIFKVLIPTLIYILLAVCLIDLKAVLDNPIVILKVLTLSYYNNPAITSIGATWYVFVLIKLYILAPLIAYFVHMLMDGRTIRRHVVVIILIALIGCCFRILTYKLGIPWGMIYVPWYMNLDLFVSGMVAAHSCKCCNSKKDNGLIKPTCGIVFFITLIVINIRIYYIADENVTAMFLYQYIFPTIWLMFVCVYFMMYIDCDFSQGFLIKGVEKLAQVSFYIYLVHSMVAQQIAPYIAIESVNKRYIVLLLITFLISLCLAVVMYRAVNYQRREK